MRESRDSPIGREAARRQADSEDNAITIRERDRQTETERCGRGAPRSSAHLGCLDEASLVYREHPESDRRWSSVSAASVKSLYNVQSARRALRVPRGAGARAPRASFAKCTSYTVPSRNSGETL